MPPIVVALKGHPVTGQVKTLALFPAVPEHGRDNGRARGPAYRRQRCTRIQIPRLGRRWRLPITRALEAEGILRRRFWPFGCRDADNHVRPGRAHVAPAPLDNAAPEFRRGEVLFRSEER